MRYVLRFYRVSEDLIRLRNRSKLVQGSLFAIIDLLLKQNLSLSTLYDVWGMNFGNNLKF